MNTVKESERIHFNKFYKEYLTDYKNPLPLKRTA